MTILIAYASKHGSTQGIAERIGAKLRQLGTDAEVQAVNAVGDLSAYEAVIIGSALYYASWLKEATAFVRDNRTELAARPVWLFSSGPTGIEVKDTDEQPKELAEFREIIGLRDHQIFFGALDHLKLSFSERILCKALRAAEGDFRDWDAIEAWAAGNARELAPVGPTPRPAQAAVS